MKKKIGRRLFQYALLYKRTIILALIMLTFAVAAELTGPFIAKTIIDKHILGIEKSWYETTEKDKDTVTYQDTQYKRADHFDEAETKGNEVRILQVGRSYYFVESSIEFDGARAFDNGQLTISRDEGEVSYPAEKLTVDELLLFYSPEIDDILRLVGFYFVLILISSGFQYGQRLYLQISSNRIIQKMRKDVFQQIQRLPIRYFDNLPAGKIVSRVTNDTEAIRDLFVTVLSTFFTSTIYITGIYIALFLLDVKLATICLILVPILVVWIYF